MCCPIHKQSSCTIDQRSITYELVLVFILVLVIKLNSEMWAFSENVHKGLILCLFPETLIRFTGIVNGFVRTRVCVEVNYLV